MDSLVAKAPAEQGPKPAAQTDTFTLLPRIHFDLVGLPPTPAEIKTFRMAYQIYIPASTNACSSNSADVSSEPRLHATALPLEGVAISMSVDYHVPSKSNDTDPHSHPADFFWMSPATLGTGDSIQCSRIYSRKLRRLSHGRLTRRRDQPGNSLNGPN